MRTRHKQTDAGPVTFRIQADRRQMEARMSGAAERRATRAAGRSLDPAATPVDDTAQAAWPEATEDGDPQEI